MSAGLIVTKTELDTRIGNICKVFNINFKEAFSMKEYFDATADQTLLDMGYNTQDIANMKTAFNDLAQLNLIWQGISNLETPKDFTAFVSRLWGTGI